MNNFSKVVWNRLKHEEGIGVIYEFGYSPQSMRPLVRAAPGHWIALTEKQKEYVRQPDGWFAVEDKAWFSMRSNEFAVALEEMDNDMDRYINDLITVIE